MGWPRQEAPTKHQRRLWQRYISSQFLPYGTLWKRVTTDSLRDLKAQLRHSTVPVDGSQDLALADLINNLPQGQRRLLTHISQCVDDSEVRKASRSKGKLTIASDGGLKDTRGTFGWTISTGDNITLYEGAGPVDGPRDVANSTRCEIAGLAAPMLLLTLLVRHWGSKPKCKFRWVCDSKAALSNVNKHTTVPAPRRRQPENADFLSQIRWMKRESGIQPSQKWIKGHQPRKSAGSKSHDVQRNNRADELATWFRDSRISGQSREKTEHVPEERVSVSINGVRQVGQVEACIRFHINGYHLRSYLQSQYWWSNKEWDMIDIKVLGQFCRSLIPTKQVAHTKLMNDQRHTGVRRNRVATIKAASLMLCPCCKIIEETSDHVLQCKENPGRSEAIKAFRKSMDALGAPSITRTLKSKLLGWINEEPDAGDLSMVPPGHVPYVEAALHQQSRIGWPAASRGFFSNVWSELASQPDDATGTHNEARGSYTMRKVMKAVHTLSTQLWTARNHHLHSTTSTECKLLRQPDLVEIEQLHAQAHMVSADDRHFCERPLGDIVNASSSVRRRWLHYMRKARARFDLDGYKQMRMTDFFQHKG